MDNICARLESLYSGLRQVLESHRLRLWVSLDGIPGAGKGTQADRLGGMRVPGFVTSSLFRGLSDLHPIVRARVAGRLAPDEDVSELVFQWIRNTCRSYLFYGDGFPRTISQDELLMRQLALDGNLKIFHVVLKINDEVSKTRQQQRAAGSSALPSSEQRPDNGTELIRIEEFKEFTQPLFEKWETEKVPMAVVDGSQSPDIVALAIATAIRDHVFSLVRSRPLR